MKTCKDCYHFEACVDKLGTTKFYDNVIAANNVEDLCRTFKDKELIVELPFIAMIEQTIENGKFCKKKSEQKFNGRYCVVYLDKDKWSSPLIDICGTRYYNKDEAESRVQVLKGGSEE